MESLDPRRIQNVLTVALNSAAFGAKFTSNTTDDRVIAALTPALTSLEFAKFLAPLLDGKDANKVLSTAEMVAALVGLTLANQQEK